jgi:hypothetical protein
VGEKEKKRKKIVCFDKTNQIERRKGERKNGKKQKVPICEVIKYL